MKIIIANRHNVNDIIKSQKRKFSIIAISDPFAEIISYQTQNNSFCGLLKLSFYDCSPTVFQDRRYIYNTDFHEGIIAFVRVMLVLDVQVLVIHCEKGRHRSYAIALGLVMFFREHEMEILNVPDSEPNFYVLNFFKANII